MERRKGADNAYSVCFENTYGFILYCQELVAIIKMEYAGADKYILTFERKCELFLEYLDSIAKNKNRLNESHLAVFLRAYTVFFNNIMEKDYKFTFNHIIMEKWNNKCLMAYIATCKK